MIVYIAFRSIMASFCKIHFQNVVKKDNTRPFTHVSWVRVIGFSPAWSQLVGEIREVIFFPKLCTKWTQCLQQWFSSPMLQTIHMQNKFSRSRKSLSSFNPAKLLKHESPAKCRRMTRGTSASLLTDFLHWERTCSSTGLHHLPARQI